MLVFRQLTDIPADFAPTFVSVGNFDGVHRAHQCVLEQIVTRARERGGKSVAVSFEPHPMDSAARLGAEADHAYRGQIAAA